jgi:hypothetical protein
MMKTLIVLGLVAIVVSLGASLIHLGRGEGKSRRMVNALSVRMALSVLLFVLLFIAWRSGLIQPHGLR